MSQATNAAIDPELVETWLRVAGKMALRGRSALHASSKDDGSLVTDVDQQIESYLDEQIARHYPGHRILGEEGIRRDGEAEYLWTVDPIDGTRAYASGLPIWGPSIGILEREEAYAGWFFMPAVGELYSGIGARALLNGRPIPPPAPGAVDGSLAFLAVPSNAHRHFEISFHRLRSLGSTTAHLAYVARGAALAALTRRLFLWDIAPVLPLLRASGIVLRYLSGRDFDLRPLLDGAPAPEALVAAPAAVIDEICGRIRSKPQG